jgi:hypothetical protein
MPENDNGMISFSNDYFMTNEINSLENTVLDAAKQTVDEEITGQGVQLTDTEMEAVVTVQVLKELNSVDLATLLLRYKYIRKIRDTNLVARHPGGYTSLVHMASDQGVSATELSRIVDLVEVVFPYLGNTLQMDIPTLWKDVGKSNFVDMLPVLKILISGNPATHSEQANASAQRFIDDAEAGYTAQGVEVPDRAQIRQEVVRDIVERGTLLNNHELRTHLRPERTPNITLYVYTVNDIPAYMIAGVTGDQLELLRRRAGAAIDVRTGAATNAPDFVQEFLRHLRVIE